jgi:nitroreductase/dihydropteridine reductase
MSDKLLKQMQWRRALKQFQPSTKTLDISSILKAACLAPTSFGIQPFQIYVVTNSELKGRIAAAAYNQPQVDYSYIISFQSFQYFNSSSICFLLDNIMLSLNDICCAF